MPIAPAADGIDPRVDSADWDQDERVHLAGWLWRGRHVKLADGTTLMPDTERNQARFPQHWSQEQGAGFPIARLVCVMSLANGAVLDVAMGPYKGKGTGEYGLFRELFDCFSEGDVLLADSYYCGFFLIDEMQARGVAVLFEQHGARHTDFRAGEKLGARDHVVTWSKPKLRPAWMTRQEYAAYPDQLTLREVKVRNKVLVTSFLSPREVWVYALAYNLIRLLMAQAAVNAAVLPRQLSFKHTVQVWVAWSQRQFLSTEPEDPAALFRLIAHVRVGNRPGRLEPRLIKTRPKPFGRLQTTRRRARANIRKYGHPKKHTA